MNKLIKTAAALCLYAACVPAGRAQTTIPATTPVSQMEKLGRGLVALKNGNGSGIFVSWRLLGTDDQSVSFNLLRDGVTIKEGITGTTCFTDNVDGTHEYSVQTVTEGMVTETSPSVTSTDDYFLRLRLDRPVSGNSSYTYLPNDCSVADLDGDGEYEIIVKWDPTNSKDNSEKGKTAHTYIDAYKLDGTKLWRIHLGYNIRAGAHYTQFLVYDFDGDGRAEMICKTAPGTKDAAGIFVSEAADDEEIRTSTDNGADYRNGDGHLTGGQEFLTVFDGMTGKAVHTIYYNPNRAGGLGGSAAYGGKSVWGDANYNRGERYLACVAYLDGPDRNPSAVMCRGYYTRAYVWAVGFDGTKLSTKWLHASVSQTEVELTDGSGSKTKKTYSANTAGTSYSKTLYGNGNHNLSVADVDGDGCDEIVYGSGAVDHDGSLLYAVGFGHGDAIHLSDLLPDRPGLEVFTVHEEKHPAYGWDIHDAATGEVIMNENGSGDNGRGMAADVDSGTRGFEFWSATDKSVRSAVSGDTLSTKQQASNFRIYWDGDAYDELFDGRYDKTTLLCNPKITKYNGTKSATELKINGKALKDLGSSMTCNTTKATPNLQADIFGDWREELVMWDATDSCTLNIFTTTMPTEYRVPTLMHDHVYRMGVAWQNTAYNQPPHLGYYLPDYISYTTGIGGVASSEGGGWIKVCGRSVDISLPEGGRVNIALYDAGGRICWRKDIRVDSHENIVMPRMESGAYVVRASSGKRVAVRKILM